MSQKPCVAQSPQTVPWALTPDRLTERCGPGAETDCDGDTLAGGTAGGQNDLKEFQLE
jgi:hypothetical protein